MWNGFWARMGHIYICEQGYKHPGFIRGGKILLLVGKLLMAQKYLCPMNF
jgi:hypothetical protein